MTKKFKKTVVTSTVESRRQDHLWALARQVSDPVDSRKEAAETDNTICVPKHLVVFARDSRNPILTRRPKRQSHNFVLIIALKGVGQICLDERIFRLDGGQALLIFPFQYRHIISWQESSSRWITIHFEMSHTDSIESQRNQPWYFTSKFTQILDQLLEVISSRNLTHETKATESQLFLALLLHQSPTQGMWPPTSSLAISTEAQKLLVRIHRFLHHHIDQPIELEDMARELGYSKSHLRHQFKKRLKVSLGGYVRKVRLHKAEALLRENIMNISAVAQACGYSSLYAFSRTFHKAMGYSPRDYRIRFKKINSGR